MQSGSLYRGEFFPALLKAGEGQGQSIAPFDVKGHFRRLHATNAAGFGEAGAEEAKVGGHRANMDGRDPVSSESIPTLL
jgi:hypothetical protein